MVTRLDLYNQAFGFLGPVRLTSLDENRPDRRELDAVYSKTKQAMLEQGIWFFALRTIEWQADLDVEPLFGLPYAYSFPTDYVRLRHISNDQRQEIEDHTFKREGQYFYSEYQTLYLTYVSNDDAFGGDLGKYTQLYADAFACDMAERSSLPIMQDRGTKADLQGTAVRLLAKAKKVEAVDERVKFKPISSFVASRNTVRRRSNDQRRENP